MHIEINCYDESFDLKVGLYLAALETVENWCKMNEIQPNIGYENDVLYLNLPTIDDYAMWVATYKNSYRLVNNTELF